LQEARGKVKVEFGMKGQRAKGEGLRAKGREDGKWKWECGVRKKGTWKSEGGIWMQLK
jgi:hypothetical protein